jgi:hypothetical protein
VEIKVNTNKVKEGEMVVVEAVIVVEHLEEVMLEKSKFLMKEKVEKLIIKAMILILIKLMEEVLEVDGDVGEGEEVFILKF